MNAGSKACGRSVPQIMVPSIIGFSFGATALPNGVEAYPPLTWAMLSLAD
jgi:hypothetical protein